MSLSNLKIDKSWTLFLDRDGVINKRIIGGYVTSADEFKFIRGAKIAIKNFSKVFGRIIVVTNQQCIGKDIISINDLNSIHEYMLKEIKAAGGRIDKVYFAPQLASANSEYRKPNSGMGLQAKKDFPEIDFKKSIMIGDSFSDMEFGKRLEMQTIFINSDKHPKKNIPEVLEVFNTLYGLVKWIQQQ